MNPSDDFEAMMRANGPKIYTLAVRLAGNAADGQDIAQDTFVKAYAHWEKFRGDADVGTWLYRICVNCWKNRVRYERRRAFWKHFSLDDRSESDENPIHELPSPEAPMDQSLEIRERQASVQAALAKLKPEDRALLVMREMDDKSYEEIAGFLEVPIGTVRSRLARAREKLVDIFSRTEP
jgi:RNA polymerase sigma-70 factor (ECF subfamily)